MCQYFVTLSSVETGYRLVTTQGQTARLTASRFTGFMNGSEAADSYQRVVDFMVFQLEIYRLRKSKTLELMSCFARTMNE
ncbi:hypothetical protein DW651_19135 [Subdoligranulum sp. AM23-21AC]|nr:hypothetical protein DW651_19135 [Subdoligranulum sp. AM23-21AC]